MPRFPKKQAQIAALAKQMWNDLWSNQAVFPHPLVQSMLIRIKKLIY